MSEIKVDLLRGCARCGFDHPGLVFRELTLPMEIRMHPDLPPIVTLTHWASCPGNSEPILMKQADDPSKS